MTKLRVVVLEDRFFERSQSGAIWSRICFEIDDHFFPDSGWTDLVVAFLAAWLEALSQMAEGSTNKERVWFMDGPFAIDVLTDGPDLFKLTFLHKEVVQESAEANVKELLENATPASKQVLDICDRRGWPDRDVRSLTEAIQRGAEILRRRCPT